MNKVRMNVATNIKETGKFILAVLMALMMIYIITITGQNNQDLKPDKVKHLSCVEVKMHLLGLDKIKELKRYKYEAIEAYYRMNCQEWEPQTIIVSPVCEKEPKGILFSFDKVGPATGTIGVKDGY